MTKFLLLDVRVIFDNDESVSVAIPDSYEGGMCGLCGNYDGVESNELQLESGRVRLARDLNNKCMFVFT